MISKTKSLNAPEIIIGIILWVFLLSANAQTFCFKSSKVKNQSDIYLQLTLNSDGKLGRIKYKGGGEGLHIKLKSEKEILKENISPPAIVERSWTESLFGDESGIYSMKTRGAAIGELTYFRKKDGRYFLFYDDPESDTESDCIWNKY